MGRKQEERGGACCCRAVREGLLCERSSGAREKKRFPRHIAREKCLPPRGICPGFGLRAAEDFSSCGRRHTLENGVPRRSAKEGRVSAGGVGGHVASRNAGASRASCLPMWRSGAASQRAGGICLRGAGDPPGDPEHPVPSGGEGCFEHLKGAIRRPACIRPDASAASCAEPPDAGRKKRPPECRRPEMTL